MDDRQNRTCVASEAPTHVPAITMKRPVSSNEREPLENLGPDVIVIVCVIPIHYQVFVLTPTLHQSYWANWSREELSECESWNERWHSHIRVKFINTAVDKKMLEVKTSDSLSPCTKDIAHVRYTVDDSCRLVFVDTPAFPGIILGHNLSAEKEVGKKISEWLKGAWVHPDHVVDMTQILTTPKFWKRYKSNWYPLSPQYCQQSLDRATSPLWDIQKALRERVHNEGGPRIDYVRETKPHNIPEKEGVFDKPLEDDDGWKGCSLFPLWDKEECMGRGDSFGRPRCFGSLIFLPSGSTIIWWDRCRNLVCWPTRTCTSTWFVQLISAERSNPQPADGTLSSIPLASMSSYARAAGRQYTENGTLSYVCRISWSSPLSLWPCNLQTQSLHSTILLNLRESVYSALTTFETGISPWTHPLEWLDVNTSHIRSIFDGIVSTANADIEPITFPGIMIFQVCWLTFRLSQLALIIPQRLIVYIFAHHILCTSDQTYCFFFLFFFSGSCCLMLPPAC